MLKNKKNAKKKKGLRRQSFGSVSCGRWLD